MVELKTPGEIAVMREAGRVVATALAATQTAATVGTSLRELDEIAATVISEAGAKPSFLHYHPRSAPSPFPAVICTSVNDAVVHGIPTSYRLAEGDVLSVDCGAYIDGLHGDSAVTFIVGAADPDDQTLVDETRRALHAGIAAATPGARMGDIAHAIGTIGRSRGFGLMENHGGHGIGRAMHEDPFVPNEGKPGRGLRLRPGLVLALEPMFLAGGNDRYRVDRDGWTLRSADGSRAAHWEHTIAVTEDGPVILTAR
ncbi:type I methionyl aminopeptidase [Micromonospora craniellae]|uniref:Methionine aminopeptidase n=1 Tax=Micromonospora craniellae TaxID=2294034 RepID=A0A372FUX0_9ACTN|nr:type I methionyl aminopeptidase [Micromonospora craniellae]QOC89789.1 type I methionyl aminopeptidase [Micromonospora craniellae]RFS44498.1 type I methionyl aminopeptidase [Micromonospora craniellae]